MKALVRLAAALIWLSAAQAHANVFNYVEDSGAFVPVILKTTAGADQGTQAASGVTVYYKKGIAGAWTQLTIQDGDGTGAGQDCATDGSQTPESGDWCDEARPGSFRVYVPNTVLDTANDFYYKVEGTGLSTYDGALDLLPYQDHLIGDKTFILSNTISSESAFTLVDADASPDIITLDDQWNTYFKIALFDATTQAFKTESCITDSVAATNTFTTRTDISAITATGDLYLVVGAPECAPEDLDLVTGTLAPTQLEDGILTSAKVADGAIDRAAVAKTRCDISAATSGTSFTIATCTSADGETITLATGIFAGRMMTAYTNGGADCNVVGQSVFGQTVTSGGVVTVRTSTVTGGQGGFSATPSTTNCGIEMFP
jgi:hypothetical protein